MSIHLFSHNKAAYETALSMLQKKGKAAVIHPTGTGKSFIGFKLAEEHPNDRILWLTPSEYIVKTQLENLQRESNLRLNNIVFLTYASLMLMSADEVSELRPKWIICDEFHRAGAKMWSEGIEKLLAEYPEIPMLGLSATNIRYLDNCRDMAEELFGGNIASQMTLGEAIVCGILQNPKYVVAMYSYDKELERMQKRISGIRNKAFRDENRRKLDALKHSLELAEGPDKIFEKHMTDRTGKYIVFCSGTEEMEELKKKTAKWFAGIDSQPHVYSVYTGNAESHKEFEAFRNDSSGHLKLLFCIDMLNEGIHVEDISGVILCRLTVSPIVYKQQIGRALAAGQKKNSVIFDLVNNFDNLYSVSSVKDEMEQTMLYYREHGMEDHIVNESFEIIDEVKDSVGLFNSIEKSLASSWELYYAAAERYYIEHSDLSIKKRYKTEDGLSLGEWLVEQRQIRNGTAKGYLTEEQIGKLDDIGMEWEPRADRSWREGFGHAEEYYREHGDLDMTADHICADGYALGRWIGMIRSIRKSGYVGGLLNEERIAQLNKMGMLWDKADSRWEENYAAAVSYYEQHGDLNVPRNYVTETGIKLGGWLCRIRALYSEKNSRLTDEDIERLSRIGMNWEGRSESSWNRHYALAEEYYRSKGDLDMSGSYRTEAGERLGRWVYHQRELYHKGKLPDRKIRKLEDIGMKWGTIGNSWNVRYEMAEKYYKEHGDLNIDQAYVQDGIWLGKWLAEQRKQYRNGTLDNDRAKKLGAIGMDWLTPQERRWETGFGEAKRYYELHGNLDITAAYKTDTGYRLGQWVYTQRKNYSKDAQLSPMNAERMERLSSIGMGKI